MTGLLICAGGIAYLAGLALIAAALYLAWRAGGAG